MILCKLTVWLISILFSIAFHWLVTTFGIGYYVIIGVPPPPKKKKKKKKNQLNLRLSEIKISKIDNYTKNL